MQDAVDSSLESETDEISLSTDAVRLVKLVQGFMAAESRPQDNSPDLDRIRDAAERPGRSSIIMVLSANSPDDWNRILNVLNISASAVPTIVIACALHPVPREVADELDLRGQNWESCAGDQLTSCLNKRLNLGESALLVVEKDSSVAAVRDRPRSEFTPRQGIPRRHNVSVATIRDDRAAIWAKPFRSDARRWIAKYTEVGDRDPYLWQWCLHGIELTTLPCVAEELRTPGHDSKLLSVILCVLFDDVADRSRNPLWLDGLFKTVQGLPCRETEPDFDECREHLRVTSELWNEYRQRVRALPDFRKLEPVWRFDLDQFFTAMKYAQLVNTLPELINPTEHDVYTPHNMLMVSFGTLDLMCSPEVPMQERGAIREALWHAQAMGRVGNVLSTWRRELREGDSSNGLVSRALANGILSLVDLERLPSEELERKLKQSHVEQDLAEKWERHRRLARRCADRVTSFDMTSVLDAHDRFLEMHLGSIGLI